MTRSGRQRPAARTFAKDSLQANHTFGSSGAMRRSRRTTLGHLERLGAGVAARRTQQRLGMFIIAVQNRHIC
jgi:hypothetical protein